MTNFEHYRDDIERFAKDDEEFAIDKYNKTVHSCGEHMFDCTRCIFNKRGCTAFEKMKWGNEEYKPKKIDWYNLKKDSILKVTNVDENTFYRCFDHYDENEKMVYCYPFGMTKKLWELSDKSWGFAIYKPSVCELYEEAE